MNRIYLEDNGDYGINLYTPTKNISIRTTTRRAVYFDEIDRCEINVNDLNNKGDYNYRELEYINEYPEPNHLEIP